MIKAIRCYAIPWKSINNSLHVRMYGLAGDDCMRLNRVSGNAAVKYKCAALYNGGPRLEKSLMIISTISFVGVTRYNAGMGNGCRDFEICSITIHSLVSHPSE